MIDQFIASDFWLMAYCRKPLEVIEKTKSIGSFDHVISMFTIVAFRYSLPVLKIYNMLCAL